MEKLNTGNWITIGVCIVACIMSLFGHYMVYVWHAPDLRYEPGAYYRSGAVAVTSLKLKNYGHAPAEEIAISASFPETLEGDVSTSEDGVKFTTTKGGNGTKAVSGTIPRLVPDQTVYVYYTIQNPAGPLPAGDRDFVYSITHKSGQGATGLPLSLYPFVTIAVLLIFNGFSYWYIGARSKRRVEEAKQRRAKLEADAAVKAQNPGSPTSAIP